MSIYRKGDSLFGTTTVWNKNTPYPFPTASNQKDVPSGGLYGPARFGYSLPGPKPQPSGSEE
jgi:hypothetical protein